MPGPVILRIDLQDSLRFPSGALSPPAPPLVIWVRAPETWVSGGAITETGKAAVLAKLYGGPHWMNGNDDGSTYVVRSFTSAVVPSAEVREAKSTWWYEVAPDGSLAKRGPGFAI